MPNTPACPCAHRTETLLCNPFSGFLLFIFLANKSLVGQSLLLCKLHRLSLLKVMVWNTKSVNTMIQPLTGVNYPLLSLKETLSSVNTIFFLCVFCAWIISPTFYLRAEQVISYIIQVIWTEHPQAVKTGVFVVCCRPLDKIEVFLHALFDLVLHCPHCRFVSAVLYSSTTQELIFQPEY